MLKPSPSLPQFHFSRKLRRSPTSLATTQKRTIRSDGEHRGRSIAHRRAFRGAVLGPPDRPAEFGEEMGEWVENGGRDLLLAASPYCPPWPLLSEQQALPLIWVVDGHYIFGHSGSQFCVEVGAGCSRSLGQRRRTFVGTHLFGIPS